MPTTFPATPPRIPGFVLAMGDAAEAAIRQGIPCAEAVARAAFAIEAEYAAAGLPIDEKETSDGTD